MDSSVDFDPTNPVFVSYRQSDGSGIADEIVHLLRAAGIAAWQDRHDLKPGNTDKRLKQAIDEGLSGAVLIVTPEVAKSRIIRTIEVPRLIELQRHEGFALVIVNAVTTSSGVVDYAAPDRLLERPPGELTAIEQFDASRAGLVHVVEKLMRQRVANLTAAIERDRTFAVSVETRSDPIAADRSGHPLDIRMNALTAARLGDLKDTNRILRNAVSLSHVDRLRIEGRIHLTVALALGATFPATRIDAIDVMSGGENGPAG